MEMSTEYARGYRDGIMAAAKEVADRRVTGENKSQCPAK